MRAHRLQKVPGVVTCLLAGAIVGMAIGPVPSVRAHEDILLQIERIDERIEAEGESGRLLWERGELRRVHEQWDLAEADLRRALELDPDLDDALLGLARNALGRGDAEAALASADAFLAGKPGDAMALLERARACGELGRLDEADAGFAAVVAAVDRAGPEIFHEWAAMLREAGPAFRDRALTVLDDGVDALGPLVTLVEPAVAIERESGNPRGALARIEALLRGPMARSVPWRITKAEILLEMGRREDARRAVGEARALFDALPARRRGVPAMLALAERIGAVESRLGDEEPAADETPAPSSGAE